MQLGSTLGAIISQTLVKSSNEKGRIAVVEIMINTATIRKLIQEGKIGMIDKAIAESALLYKMQTQNQHLFRLIEEGKITKVDALSTSRNQNDLRIMFQTQTMDTDQKPGENEGSGKPGGIPGKRSSPFDGNRPSGQGK
jgi:Tfp pilus assembly ATPase PilU